MEWLSLPESMGAFSFLQVNVKRIRIPFQAVGCRFGTQAADTASRFRMDIFSPVLVDSL